MNHAVNMQIQNECLSACSEVGASNWFCGLYFSFLMQMFWFIKCCSLFWLKTQDAQLRIIVYYSHQNGLKLQKKNETYFSIITSTSFLFTPNAVIMKQVNKCIALHWKNFIKTKRNETKQQRKKTNMNYNKRMKQTWKIEYT